jgi:RNA polymerase sigma factor (sigma-70 family)
MASTLTNGRTTDPRLLERVRDWRDSQAWARFVAHYEPHLRAVCRAYGLVGASADDCCQEVWIKLAATMRRFHYDPGGRFRSWLGSFFQSRVKDVLKASRGRCIQVTMSDDVAFDLLRPGPDEDEPCDPEILAMLRRAEEVQDAVRARITPENWEVFRLIGIEGWPIADTARSLDKEYTTVYRSYQRVSRIIEAERRRRSLGGQASVPSEPCRNRGCPADPGA